MTDRPRWHHRDQGSAAALDQNGREPRGLDRTRASAGGLAPRCDVVAPPPTGDGGAFSRARPAVPVERRTEGVIAVESVGPPLAGYHPSAASALASSVTRVRRGTRDLAADSA